MAGTCVRRGCSPHGSQEAKREKCEWGRLPTSLSRAHPRWPKTYTRLHLPKAPPPPNRAMGWGLSFQHGGLLRTFLIPTLAGKIFHHSHYPCWPSLPSYHWVGPCSMLRLISSCMDLLTPSPSCLCLHASFHQHQLWKVLAPGSSDVSIYWNLVLLLQTTASVSGLMCLSSTPTLSRNFGLAGQGVWKGNHDASQAGSQLHKQVQDMSIWAGGSPVQRAPGWGLKLCDSLGKGMIQSDALSQEATWGVGKQRAEGLQPWWPGWLGRHRLCLCI
jgi:hypothetical protein